MRNWILFLLFLMLAPVAEASHLLGGEISYRCLGNGNYRFRVVVFRDCNGISFNQTNVALLGPIGVNCNLVASYDVTPRSQSTGSIRCDPPATFSSAQGGIGKFVYEGTANLSSLGVAPLTGYTWTTSTGSIPCCRNSSSNSNCSGDMVLRVTMYRFIDANGTALTPAQICDNSPVFLEDPAAVTIFNTFDTSVFNNFAQDLDPSDDVRFFIDNPWTGVGLPCNYTGSYSIANPLPGLVGPGVDSVTGVIKYRPNQTGRFQTAIRAESRRCGQKISEIFRDFQLNIIVNPPGARPPFNPLLPDSLKVYQQKAPIFEPFLFNAAGDPVFEAEIYAFDTLLFPLKAFDLYPLFDPPTATIPFPMYNPDSVFIFATGPQMGANGTSTTTGCLLPPCATITRPNSGPPIPIRYFPTGEILGYGFAGLQIVDANLNWVPSCANLPDSTLSACGTGITSYQFGVVAFDDANPIRGKTSQVYTVKVKALPVLDAPILRTVSVVNNNSGVELSWSHRIDTVTIDPVDSTNLNQFPAFVQRQYSVNRRRNAFRAFRIYRATDPAGPFVNVGQTNALTDTTFIDNTVVPYTQYYYYVVTVSGCANVESDPSEIGKTVDLQLINNVAAGRAELSWDSLALNNVVTSTGTPVLFIDREVFSRNPGVWVPMDTVLGTFAWNQSVVVCDDSVNYRVGYLDSSMWVSYSWVRGDDFQDNFAPPQLTVVQASVDNATNTPYLSWDPSPDLDVNRYVVYQVDESTTPPTLLFLDTVYGYNSTFWYDQLSGQDPTTASLLYGVAAMDSCDNLGVVSITNNTIWLRSNMNQCTSSMEIQWNEYRGWGAGNVREYELYRAGGGSAMSLLTTVSANTFEYVDAFNLIQDSTYCYEIRAIRNDDSTAVSNLVCVVAKVITAPQLTYIRKVSVDTLTSQIHVDFISDTAASSARFVVERAVEGSDFREVSSFDLSQATVVGPFYTYRYTDAEANSGERAYLYRIVAYDVCSQAFDTSEVVSSIFLQAVPAIDFSNALKWNDYTGFLGGLDNYTVLRRIPSTELTYLPLNLTGFGSPVYNDDITNFTDNDGNYMYFIEALEGNTNPLGLKDTVHSNVVTVTQQPRIFFPNAFLPLGVNREFRGKGVFIEETTGFNMQVYNRWGEKLFETNDYTLGWDGRAPNDEFVMPGVYVYVVNFIGKNQKAYSQKGTLTILR